MRKAIYLVLAMLMIIVVVSCDSGGGTGYNCIRKVYEVSEENISGNGGYVDIIELEGIGDYSNMPSIVIYGDKRTSGIEWHLIADYYTFCKEGRVYIDTGSGYSDFYRIVVVK